MSLLNDGQPVATGSNLAPATDHTTNTDTSDLSYDELRHRYETEQKRYRDLQSYTDKRLNSQQRQLEEYKKQSSSYVAPRTPEELQELKAKDPELFEAFETMIYDKAQEYVAPVQAEVNRLQQREAMIQIQAAHPDYMEISQSDHFKQWAEQEGPEIQAWINEESDPRLPIKALSYYKSVVGYNPSMQGQAPMQEPQAPVDSPAPVDMAQNVSLNSGTPSTHTQRPLKQWTRDEIEKMHVDTYLKHKDEIEAAMAAGLVR